MSDVLEIKSVRWVLLGAVVGVGNFFTTPNELARIGAFAYLFWHLISLLFLCAPLACAELMWGKWLRRPLHDSFEIVHPKLRNLAVIILLTIGIAFPPYIYSFSTFFVKSLLFFGNSIGLSSQYLQGNDFIYLPYFGSILLAAMAILTLNMSQSSFAKLIRALMIAGFAGCIWVAIEVIRLWGVSDHIELLQRGLRNTSYKDVMRVTNFSFFSMTLCCSIFYSLIQWVPKKRSEEGGLIKLAFFLALGDFAASLICFLIVAPFVKPGFFGGPVDVYLDWIPHSIIYLHGGYGIVFLLCLSLLMLGFCTIAAIFWVCADHLEVGLNQSRQNTLVRLSWWSAVALFLPIIPKLRVAMSDLALHVLLPLSALIFAVCVVWKMPRKSQNLMLGRGFVLDSMVHFWRFSMIYLVIPYLVLSLIL